MLRLLGHLCMVVFLTLLAQIGGVAWILSRLTRYPLIAFLGLYIILSAAAHWAAPLQGRVALSCRSDGPLQMQSWMYCALNRHYVTPELADVLQDTAATMEAKHPGTVTLVLDGNFPFLTGFPLLPHLSHDDGEKVDLAFFYRDQSGYLPGKTRSPIGYFAFEDGPTQCPKQSLSLRWDMQAIQPLWRDLELDEGRTKSLMTALTNDPRVSKVFLEPHLKSRLGLSSSKIRFQGCRAARHDDHIHFQI